MAGKSNYKKNKQTKTNNKNNKQTKNEVQLRKSNSHDMQFPAKIGLAGIVSQVQSVLECRGGKNLNKFARASGQ